MRDGGLGPFDGTTYSDYCGNLSPYFSVHLKAWPCMNSPVLHYADILTMQEPDRSFTS